MRIEEGLHFVGPVADRSEELETHRVQIRVFEMANDDLVDWAKGRSHQNESKSDDWYRHFHKYLI